MKDASGGGEFGGELSSKRVGLLSDYELERVET